MEVYAGLLLITLGISYLVVRFFQLSSASNVVNDKAAGSLQKQSRSSRRKRSGLAGLSVAGSRFKRTDKTMTMARRSPALNAGIIQKPWGW